MDPINGVPNKIPHKEKSIVFFSAGDNQSLFLKELFKKRVDYSTGWKLQKQLLHLCIYTDIVHLMILYHHFVIFTATNFDQCLIATRVPIDNECDYMHTRKLTYFVNVYYFLITLFCWLANTLSTLL